MKAITASYQWTEDAMITAQLHHLQGTKKRLRWLRIVALGGMIAVATWLIMQEFVINPTILGLVGVAYIAVIISEVTRHPKWIERSAKKLFDRALDKEQTVRFEIDGRAIHASTEGVGSGTTAWEDVHQIVETNDGFLIYLNKQVFLWVPAEAFKPKSDIARFRKLIKDKKKYEL